MCNCKTKNPSAKCNCVYTNDPGNIQNINLLLEGKSAYELAVQRGYIGNLDQWLASLNIEIDYPVERILKDTVIALDSTWSSTKINTLMNAAAAINKGPVAIEKYGAIGDGVADDTNAFKLAILDNIKAVITTPLSGTRTDGKKNYWNYIQPTVNNYILLTGKYKVTQSIPLPPYTRFQGNSSPNLISNEKSGSTIIASGISGIVFPTANVRFSDGAIVTDAFVTAADIDQGGYTYVSNIEFDRVTFTRDTTKSEIPLHYIKLSGSTHSKITNCNFIDSYIPVVINTSWNWTLKNNFFTPRVCGYILTESITTGENSFNEVNGQLMAPYTNNNLPYGLASNAGKYYSGKTVGYMRFHCNEVNVNNVTEFGMDIGVVSESSSGIIDNPYVEGINAGGVAFYQNLSAYQGYRLGEISLASTVNLFRFNDFARSEIHFIGNVTDYTLFGYVHPSCDIKLYQFRNPNVVLPKGVVQMDNWGSDVNDHLQNVLGLNIAKHFNLVADCPLDANVNLRGDKLVLGNGKTTETIVNATARIFAFTKDILFKDLTINVNTAGFISPIIGEYKISFENCKINLSGGPLITNDQAYVGEINKVILSFDDNCIVSSDIPRYLISDLDPDWARLDVTIIKSQSTFTNVYIPHDSIPLKIEEVTGFIGFPTIATRADGASYPGGKMLHTDPAFKDGLNGLIPFNNLNNGNLTLTRVVADATTPTESGWMLKVTNLGTTSPDNGGFSFNTQTRPNAIFKARFIAKLPIGAFLDLTTDFYGDDGYTTEDTTRIGTGNWEEYIFTVRCGNTGTFLKTNSFSTRGTANQSWYIAYATVYDMTADPDFIQIDDTTSTTTSAYSSSRVNSLLGVKVDKVTGKGLSTNDYTDEDKQALALKQDFWLVDVNNKRWKIEVQPDGTLSTRPEFET